MEDSDGSSIERKTRVLLADDHTMFREGLAELISSYGGMEIVGSTTNDSDAAALVERTRPDVVIMQVQMPFERAKEILARMRSLSPPPKVVIVTMFENPRYVRELMQLGASAYLLKSSSSSRLIDTIRAPVLQPVGEDMIVDMPRPSLEQAKKASANVLSARQLEILLLAARGLSNRQIASSLHLTEGTVKRHLSDAYKNMDVTSRSEAARKAFREGWFSASDVTDHDDEHDE